jgi:hypothetical protein
MSKLIPVSARRRSRFFSCRSGWCDHAQKDDVLVVGIGGAGIGRRLRLDRSMIGVERDMAT